MSISDDWKKSIDSELAKIDENSRQLTLAQNRFAESAVISVVNMIVDRLEEEGIITKTASSIVKNSANIIRSFGQFLGWW
ncbi:hypothetical protein AM228_10025 [Planktothricoides sp. SR001]|nr:hypothetical protein AM228_10025 [Planktothricoides sp. SR001]